MSEQRHSAEEDAGLRAAVRAAIYENIAAPHERYDAATDAVLAVLTERVENAYFLGFGAGVREASS